MDLKTYLTQVRRERGFSLRELAERSGYSAAEICRVESGVRQKPSPVLLRALADALIVPYATLMQLAGYMEEEGAAGAEPEKPEAVFRDGRTGRIVDVPSGAREMMRTDEVWANTAYRVSTELSESDRRLLTEMANAFLKRSREQAELPEEEKR